jgi:hypothetical protein
MNFWSFLTEGFHISFRMMSVAYFEIFTVGLRFANPPYTSGPMMGVAEQTNGEAG